MQCRDLTFWGFQNSDSIISQSSDDIGSKALIGKYICSNESGIHYEDLDVLFRNPALLAFNDVFVDGNKPFVFRQSLGELDAFYAGIQSDAKSAFKGFFQSQYDSENLNDLRNGKCLRQISGSSIVSCFGSKYFGYNLIYCIALASVLKNSPEPCLPVYFATKRSIPSIFIEIIERIGVSWDNCETLSPDLFYSFENLWLPFIPLSFDKKRPQTTSCNFFDNFRERIGVDLIEPSFKNRNSRRLYISRNDALYRRVVNEDQLVEVLRKYSFEVVQASTLTLDERINIMGQAEVIISSAGSNLFNCTFAPPGCQVGELLPAIYTKDSSNVNVLKTVVSGCRQYYSRIWCDAIEDEAVKYSKWDFTVPIPNVEFAIRQMLDNLGYGG